MIAYLKGQVRLKSNYLKKENFIILDTGGVGYRVYVLDRLLNELTAGQTTEVFVYTQVAEGVLDLYGFANSEELEFFELLLSLNGIGPRSALDILRKAKIDDITTAVQSGSHEILSKVSGIGPKTAEKIVLGLKDKLGGVMTGAATSWNDSFGDALEALVSLGYSPGQAREALNQCQSLDAGEKIKEALKILGR